MLSLVALLSVLALLLVGTLLRPTFALAGVLLLFPLDQWATTAHPVFAAHGALVNVFIAGLVALALLSENHRRSRARVRLSAVWLLVLLLYAYAYTSNIWAPYGPDRSLELLPYLVLYLLLSPMLVREIGDLRTPLHGFLVLGVLVSLALLGFAQFGGRGLIVGEGLESYETPPLALGQFGGAVALAFMFIRPQGYERLMAIARPIAVTLAFLIIFKSGSRGQLVGVVISILVVWPLINRGGVIGRYGKGSLVLGVVALIIWFAFDLSGTSAYRWSLAEEGTGTWAEGAEARFEMWKIVVEAWYSDPITILFGLGNSASFSQSLVGYYPHNVPVEVLAEEGVLGLSVYLAAIILSYRAFRRLVGRLYGHPEAIGHLGFLFSFFVYNFALSTKQSALLGNEPMQMFCVGIILANLDLATSSACSVNSAAKKACRRLPEECEAGRLDHRAAGGKKID